MKRGSMLINTARGALVDIAAAVEALKSREPFWHFDIDVYEEEGPLLFEDLSSTIIQDDEFARLITSPNVIVTGRKGFLTREALTKLAEISLANARDFEAGKPNPANRVEVDHRADGG